MSATDIYLQVRREEGRLYADDIVRQLPVVPANHPLRDEWQARAASCDRLIQYLATLRRPFTMLELGCGNGWLAHQVADATGASVVGLDVNRSELLQAQRLFGARPNLAWIVADVNSSCFCRRAFDVVVMASSIQYFADLSLLFQSLIGNLKHGGEIHILDSPFYPLEEVPAARERTRKYYAALGFPEMANHYHHHTTAPLAEHNPDWLYVPQQHGRRENLVKDSPFPWVRLRPKSASR